MNVLFAAFFAASVAVAQTPNLILISLDTTRADALSCDEGTLPGDVLNAASATPVLDGLAAQGIRFTKFWSNAPTTLNAHTTMMTGLDPHGHAVARNGTPLDSSLYTLAERLGVEGFDTIGIVGAAALEREMNFHQGFRVFDDTTDDLQGIMYQQRAAGVVDRAMASLAERDPNKPLFLFVHFYDPHTPYDPPAPFDSRFTDPSYKGPFRENRSKLAPLVKALNAGTADAADVAFVNGLYLGEVAYLDSQLGRLIDGLRSSGLLDNALLVVTADHGEVLSEDPIYAYSHGADVSDGAMRIPLIVKGYGLSLPEGRVVEREASLAGLAPTLERALNLDPQLGDRHDFWDLIRPGPVRFDEAWPESGPMPIFMEATRPRQFEPKEGWNNLLFYRSVRAGGFAMVGAPVFDLAYEQTAGERSSGVLESLRYLLERWDAAAPSERVDTPMAPGTMKALKALGYLDDEP